MITRRKIAATAALLSAGLSFCSGCESRSSDYYGTTRPRHEPGEIWSNLGTEPEWIDPGKCKDQAGGTIVFNAFAGLVQPHPKTLRPMPDIARNWRVSEDGLTYTFFLRPSVWSDGRPVTAHDFVYSWRRVLDRDTASQYASFLYPILGAEALHRQALLLEGLDAEVTAEQVEGVVAPIAELEHVEVERIDGGSRALVFLGGAFGERPEGRKRVIAALSGKRIGEATLSPRVVDGEVLAARALDEHTLEVKLVNPVPYFLNLMMFYTAFPVPGHVIEALEADGQNPDLWTRPEHIVSNGAFVLKEWQFRQRAVLERNPRYWDAAHVKPDRVRFSMVESYNTTLNLYEAGELDYIGESSVPAEFIDHLRRFEDFEADPYLATYFYWVNTDAEPLDDARVRRALRLAIDRKSLVEYVTRGGQVPTADLVPDGVAGYQGLDTPLFDQKRARALLAEAGYGDDNPLPPITLTYNTSEGHKQIAEAVQYMWKKHLGIRVTLANQEWKVFLKNLTAMEFQLARMGWIGDYPDPFTFLELLTRTNGNNHSNWGDAEYDRLLDKANATQDRRARLALLREAEQRLAEAAPVIPIYVYVRAAMVKPYILGHFHNYQSRDLYKYYSIDERFYDGVPEQRLPNTPPEHIEGEL